MEEEPEKIEEMNSNNTQVIKLPAAITDEEKSELFKELTTILSRRWIKDKIFVFGSSELDLLLATRFDIDTLRELIEEYKRFIEILGLEVVLPLGKDLPPKGASEGRTPEEKTSGKGKDHILLYVLTTDLPSRTDLAGMSGCPVYNVRSRRIIGMLKGEDMGGPGASYLIPMDVIYERWPELRPSWWRDTAYATLVGTEKWEELPWLFIFLFVTYVTIYPFPSVVK